MGSSKRPTLGISSPSILQLQHPQKHRGLRLQLSSGDCKLTQNQDNAVKVVLPPFTVTTQSPVVKDAHTDTWTLRIPKLERQLVTAAEPSTGNAVVFFPAVLSKRRRILTGPIKGHWWGKFDQCPLEEMCTQILICSPRSMLDGECTHAGHGTPKCVQSPHGIQCSRCKPCFHCLFFGKVCVPTCGREDFVGNYFRNTRGSISNPSLTLLEIGSEKVNAGVLRYCYY